MFREFHSSMSRKNSACGLQVDTLAERTRQFCRLQPLLPGDIRIPIRRARLASSMALSNSACALAGTSSSLPSVLLRFGCESLFCRGQCCLGILHSRVLIVGVHLLGRFCHSAHSSGLARALHMTPLFSPQPRLLQMFKVFLASHVCAWAPRLPHSCCKLSAWPEVFHQGVLLELPLLPWRLL